MPEPLNDASRHTLDASITSGAPLFIVPLRLGRPSQQPASRPSRRARGMSAESAATLRVYIAMAAIFPLLLLALMPVTGSAIVSTIFIGVVYVLLLAVQAGSGGRASAR